MKRFLRSVCGIIFLSLLTTPGLVAQDLPNYVTDHFSGSGVCVLCHTDLQDTEGSVSIIDDWRSTMMANASRDPLWQTKVYSETQRNPAIADAIIDKCSTCHTPMARAELSLRSEEVTFWDGGILEQTHELYELAIDGVSCTLCHQILGDNLEDETSFSGHFLIDTATPRPDRKIYGPYMNPITQQMRGHTAFTPAFSDHVEESALCATCHTLYTPVIDSNGDHIADFPEQTPYLEWLQSVFAADPDRAISCQDCHMPKAAGPVAISDRPRFLLPREPFYKHYFIGGNVTMLETLYRNAEELELTTTTSSIRRTIERTKTQLQSNSARIVITDTTIEGTTLTTNVRVENMTGHKFPTGFPSRSVWIHFTVTDSTGAMIFESGKPDENGIITGNAAVTSAANHEPHYTTIRNQDEVQIYEIIMGNLDHEVTYTLLDASERIKDNRLLPVGFDTRDAPQDISIEGKAADDPDFLGGSDTVRYEIRNIRGTPPFTVQAELLYQTISYRFWADLMSEQEPREGAHFDAVRDLGAHNNPTIISVDEVMAE